MAVVYYPLDSVMMKRSTVSASYEQVVLSTHPNTILYFGSGSDLNEFSASTVYITCSWANTASFLLGAIESSSYSTFSVTSSYSISASWAPTLGVSESSSWASSSISASYALTASYISGSLASETASYAIFTETASYVDGTVLWAISASYASSSTSTSYALSASWAPMPEISESSSWASSSISASYALTASYVSRSLTSETASYAIFAATASYVDGTVLWAISASYASSSTSTSYALSASWAPMPDVSESSSWASSSISASYALTASYLSGSYGIATQITGSDGYFENTITALNLVERSTYKIKKDIKPLSNQLDKVIKLNPVSYLYRDNNSPSIGFIAEELSKIYPEFTSTNHDAISYGKIAAVLVQCIKELKQEIDVLKRK